MRKRRKNHLGFEDRVANFQQPRLDTGQFWWVVAMEEGKRYVIGPSYSEQDAWDLGYQKLDCPFEVRALRTRDTATATRMLKGKQLQETGNLGDAVRRTRHKV